MTSLMQARHPSPLVSVVIPAYNTAEYIRGTLGSVFAQSFANYEVLVVNDGSPDTPALKEALLPYVDRIVYLEQPNTGPSGARNLAILEARGTYVALLDSDDEWMPEYLSEQMRLLTADPAIDLLYSNGIVCGDTPMAGRTLMSLTRSRGPVSFERLIEERCTVLTSCTVARRAALIQAGLFDDRFRRCEDCHLWLRLAFHGGRITYHRKPLVRHRRRRGSLSESETAMLNAFIDVMRDIEATLPLSRSQQALVRRHIADRQAYLALQEGKRLFLAEHYPAAAAALATAARHEPSRWKRGRLRTLRAVLQTTPRLLRRLYARLREPSPSVARGHPV